MFCTKMRGGQGSQSLIDGLCLTNSEFVITDGADGLGDAFGEKEECGTLRPAQGR